VHGGDGLDELTTTTVSHVCELKNGKIRRFEISPGDLGLATATAADIRGDDPEQNAAAIRALFDGRPLVAGVKALLSHIHGDPTLAAVKPPLAAYSAADRRSVASGYDAVRARRVA